MKKLVEISLGIIVLLLITNAWGDALFLKNGFVVDCTIIEEADGYYMVEMYGGRVKFTRDEVQSVSYGESSGEEIKNFEEEQKAKGLIEYKDRWISKDEFNKLQILESQEEIANQFNKDDNHSNKVPMYLEDEKKSVPSRITTSEVTKASLNIFYELGRFEGYIIFYNKKAEECAVKTLSVVPSPAILYTGQKGFRKELSINPGNFEYLVLQSGKVIYAYPISPFVVKNILSEKAIFIFEWENIRASDEVYILD